MIFEPQYQLILAKVCRVGNNLNNQTTRVMKRLEVKKLKTLTDIDSSYFFNIISEIIFNENELKYSRLLQPSRGNRKKIRLDRSVRWSEELSFRANHHYIMSGNT